jgi:hypothetical protein
MLDYDLAHRALAVGPDPAGEPTTLPAIRALPREDAQTTVSGVAAPPEH